MFIGGQRERVREGRLWYGYYYYIVQSLTSMKKFFSLTLYNNKIVTKILLLT